MASYTSQVAALHKKFGAQVRKARTRKAIAVAYRKHRADHERLLRRHLREERAMVARAKDKIGPR